MKRLAVLAIALVVCGTAAAAEAPRAIQAQAVLLPQVVHFGDTLTARVDVLVDPRLIDPDAVRVRTDFAPWELVQPPVRVRKDGAGTAHVSVTYVLRCLTSPCVPPRDTAPRDFTPALVTYPGGSGRLDVTWPRLVVHSRIPDRGSPVGPSGGSNRQAQFPWTADVVTLPAVSYRIPPGLLLALLLAGGGLLVLAGAWLGYRALPERRVAPEPVPAPPPEPPLPPLLRALVLLEDPEPQDGTADRRRALELVAEALAGRDETLAASARALAWREDAPPPSETNGLAAKARVVLRPLLAQEAAEDA